MNKQFVLKDNFSLFSAFSWFRDGHKTQHLRKSVLIDKKHLMAWSFRVNSRPSKKYSSYYLIYLLSFHQNLYFFA